MASIILAALLPAPAAAHEIPIETPTEFRLEGARVTERPIALLFDDFHLLIRHRESREDLLKLLYAEITGIRYENAAQPQALEAHPVPSPELKRHWLTFYYRQQQQEEAAVLLLSLDEYDYRAILKITQMLTGILVEGAPEE